MSNLTKTFISDAQTGSVKLSTSLRGIVKHLNHPGDLCRIVFVYVKHQSFTKALLPQKIVQELDSHSESVGNNNSKIFVVINDLATRKQSGSQGTIANQTKLLVNMISKELKALESLVKKQNTTYTINIAIYFYSHATVHSRKLFHTVLQEARNSVNIIYESIKHVVLRAGGLQIHS